MKSRQEIEEVARQIEAMTLPDRLRLAAGLMEAKRGDIAYPIIDRVATELGAALLLKRGPS